MGEDHARDITGLLEVKEGNRFFRHTSILLAFLHKTCRDERSIVLHPTLVVDKGQEGPFKGCEDPGPIVL